MNSRLNISLIIPCHNEEDNVNLLYSECIQYQADYSFEFVFVNDGSTDSTVDRIVKLQAKHSNIILIDLSRNFGKEAAVSAGLEYCNGDAAIIVDADLQYPINMLPDFIAKWETGAKHVIGLRNKKQTNNIIEKLGSKLFGKLMNFIGERGYDSRALDYRLLDRVVINEFKKLKEHNRIVRGLLDWLSFDPVYIEYTEKPRLNGTASYDFRKRFYLALNAFVYHSVAPLLMIFFVGIIVTTISFIIGIALMANYLIFAGTLLPVSGTFALGIFNTFMIGIVLIAVGLLAIYVGTIRTEVMNRPVYVVKDIKRSDK
jgi:polyisoprenyl-phosphate glycosyltransferase